MLKDITERDELQPLEQAVSDTLDEYLHRFFSIAPGWSYPVEFIELLEKRKYTICYDERREQKYELH